MDQEEQGRKKQELIHKAWTDETFKQKLLANPHEVLDEAGIEVPEGIQVRVVENTAEVFHYVLPAPPPTEGELDDSELDKVAGGWAVCKENSLFTGPSKYVCW